MALGQSKQTSATAPDFRFNPDTAAIGLDRKLAKGQTQAKALPQRFPGRVRHLYKFIENPFMIVWRDPNAIIAHIEA